MHASRIHHPHMSHPLQLWFLLTGKICFRKSTAKPQISQLHLRALLQGISVVRDVKHFIFQQQTHCLIWVCAAVSLLSHSSLRRNLTSFTHFMHGKQRCWETAWDQLEPLNTHLPSPSSAPLFSSRCGPPRISPDVQPAAASSRHLEPPTRRTLQCNTGPRVQFAPLNPPRS